MIVIAHRGASLHAPEHTVEAYDLALEQGADALEIDVRLTADGQLVAVHDQTLQRTTGDPRAVADLHAREIASLPSPERPVALDDLLDRYGRRTRLLVELKDPEAAGERRIVDAVAEHGLTDRVVLQSFDHAALRRIQRSAPELAVAALYRRASDGPTLVADAAEVASWACAMTCPVAALDGDVLAAAAHRDVPVWTYTINDVERARALDDLGVAAIITDTPAAVRDARRPALAR